jgi:hypothetical protein
VQRRRGVARSTVSLARRWFSGEGNPTGGSNKRAAAEALLPGG